MANIIPISIGKNVYTFQKSLAEKINADGGRKTQHKRLCFVCYDEGELSTFLQNTHPYSFAWIKHDKDLKGDGTPKEVHLHCVVKYDYGITVVAFEKSFSGNVFVEIPYDDDACVAYLTHKGKKGKYQYDEADVVSFTDEGKKSFFVSKTEYKGQQIDSMIADMQSMPIFELYRKYGRDMMLNYDRYMNAILRGKNDAEFRAMQEFEVAYLDDAMFTQYGVDYRQYCLKCNGDLLIFLAERLGNCTQLCDMDMMRGFLCDFQRFAVENRRAYIRAHRCDAFDVAMDKLNEGLVVDGE